MRLSPTSANQRVAAGARAKLGLVSFAALSVLAAAQLGASCVDGVTPDCSDPAVCAPGAVGVDGGDEGSSTVLPEASTEVDANGADGGDARNDDADTDGG
jgi:hypothetical protein